MSRRPLIFLRSGVQMSRSRVKNVKIVFAQYLTSYLLQRLTTIGLHEFNIPTDWVKGQGHRGQT